MPMRFARRSLLAAPITALCLGLLAAPAAYAAPQVAPQGSAPQGSAPQGSAPQGSEPQGRATEAAFTEQAFTQAQKAGKPILVHVWASWCPTCQRQAPLLRKLAAAPDFRDLTILTVNFDTQKNVVKQFGVRQQSTLIAYRGTKEVGRSVGDTDADTIKMLIAQAEQ